VFDTAGFYGSIAPAVWTFMLALRSRGLGSAYTTLHLANEREAAESSASPSAPVVSEVRISRYAVAVLPAS
jgi:hypothetical protein